MRRREHLAVAALALLVFLAYAWSAHFWIEPVDEGYFLDLADRVTRGQLPYRDFSTYYTPGIFYLFAATFKLFGPNLLWPRYLMAGIRAATFLLTYGLTRRVAPWPFALLPFSITALLDNWPIEPEPHPSWPAMLLCLLTIELTIRHLCSSRLRWLVLAGASTAACCLFKQNIGAFTALGLASYLVLRPSSVPAIVKLVYAAAISAAVTVFLWPLMDGPLAAAVWLPVLAAIGLATREELRAQSSQSSATAEIVAVAAPFALITALWLIPLAAALGPANVPYGLFVGAVNETSIGSRFADFSGGIRLIGLAAIWLPTALVRTRMTMAVAVALTVVLALLPLWQGSRDPPTRDPLLLPVVAWLNDAFGTFHIYVPALAAWGAIAAIALTRAPGPPIWYLLFAALAWLSVFPRSDTLHALVSSPPLLVCGAYALYRAYCATRRRLIVPALLLLPVVAIAAQLSWRIANVVAPEQDMPRFAYTSLDLARAPVAIPSQWAGDIRNVVTYITSNTQEGEPFLAYPVEPIFNFLTERPNPTHFDHYLPGTLTARDLDAVIADLEKARPRYILWNHYNVRVWDTDPANRPLSDYIWTCYREVETFNLYLVLERRQDVC